MRVNTRYINSSTWTFIQHSEWIGKKKTRGPGAGKLIRTAHITTSTHRIACCSCLLTDFGGERACDCSPHISVSYYKAKAPNLIGDTPSFCVDVCRHACVVGRTLFLVFFSTREKYWQFVLHWNATSTVTLIYMMLLWCWLTEQWWFIDHRCWDEELSKMW